MYSSTFLTVKKGKISVLSDTRYSYPILLYTQPAGRGITQPTLSVILGVAVGCLRNADAESLNYCDWSWV